MIPIFSNVSYSHAMLSTRLFRSLALNAIFLLSISLAHHMGGGDLQFSPTVIPLFVFSVAILTTRPPRELQGPTLALILVAFQVIGHFTSNVPPAQSTLRMSFSHIFAVVASYVLTRKSENYILNLLAFVQWAFIPRTFRSFVFSFFKGVLIVFGMGTLHSERCGEIFRNRAPPFELGRMRIATPA